MIVASNQYQREPPQRTDTKWRFSCNSCPFQKNNKHLTNHWHPPKRETPNYRSPPKKPPRKKITRRPGARDDRTPSGRGWRTARPGAPRSWRRRSRGMVWSRRSEEGSLLVFYVLFMFFCCVSTCFLLLFNVFLRVFLVHVFVAMRVFGVHVCLLLLVRFVHGSSIRQRSLSPMLRVFWGPTPILRHTFKAHVGIMLERDRSPSHSVEKPRDTIPQRSQAKDHTSRGGWVGGWVAGSTISCQERLNTTSPTHPKQSCSTENLPNARCCR